VSRVAKAFSRRMQIIQDLLSRDDRLTISSLAAALNISPATARRDLRRMEEQGLLRRDHGGAMARDPLMYEPFLHDSTFREQVRRCALEKQRIGMSAAELVQDGEKVGLGGGTTVAKILRGLHHKKDLSVVTYAVNVAMELSRQKNLHVYVVGGYLSGDWFALVGPSALESIPQHFMDKFIFGASGIHSEKGVTDHHPEEAAMNRAMIKQAQTRILVIDHTKLGVVSKCLVCPIEAINVIITDEAAPDEIVKPYLEKGLDVRRV
jgi:DeoR/GlpR family transcriptional regulator of sugar metabolism